MLQDAKTKESNEADIEILKAQLEEMSAELKKMKGLALSVENPNKKKQKVTSGGDFDPPTTVRV